MVHPLEPVRTPFKAGARTIVTLEPSCGRPAWREALERFGWIVIQVPDVRAAAYRARQTSAEAVILDWSLGSHTIAEACDALGRTVALLVLTPAGKEEVSIEALEAGADDCLLTPCNVRELQARLRALLRARRRLGAATLGGLDGLMQLHPAGRITTLSGQSAQLTAIQQRLMECLAQDPGRVVSRAELVEALYGSLSDVSDRAIDAHVYRLRKLLCRRLGVAGWITSYRGVGYRLCA